MKTILFLSLAAIAAFAIFGALLKQKGPSKRLYRYRARRVMSAPEQVAFHRLVKALPGRHVLPQVSFSRFLATNDGRAAFNAVRQKVADFAICGPDFSVLSVVELDDATHNKSRDDQRDEILRSAGIEVVRWHVKRIPTEEEIAAELRFAPKELQR